MQQKNPLIGNQGGTTNIVKESKACITRSRPGFIFKNQNNRFFFFFGKLRSTQMSIKGSLVHVVQSIALRFQFEGLVISFCRLPQGALFVI